MPKLYYPTPDELQGARPLNEQLWFPRNQSTLLRLANTNEGRDLLCLNSFPELPIVEMRKNMVRYGVGGGQFVSDFRIGAKWGNIIRFRWSHVRPALARMALEEVLSWPSLGGRQRIAAARFTTGIFFPDPSPQETSVDGRASRTSVNETFATIRAGAGTNSNSSGNQETTLDIRGSSTTNQYESMARSFFFFDTSELDDADTIDSATFEMVILGKTVEFSGNADLVDAILASNTAVLNADYQGTVGAVTVQAGDVSMSSLTANDSTYNVWTLNSTGIGNISKAGITKFGIRSSFDVDNSAPSWSSLDRDAINGRFADYTGTTKDPKLVVIYTTPFTPKVLVF